MSAYAAVVLAGGFSRRIRRPKPLLPLGDATVTDRIISTFISTGVDVLLVTGHLHEEVRAGIGQHDITFVHNPDYARGMFTSVRAGVSRLSPGHRGFFIQPVDIPLVRPATIKRLLAAAAENPQKIIHPVFTGKRGHPPLIPAALAPDILGWGKGGGLKAVLQTHQDLALEVPVPDSFIRLDIDTPEDYAALLKRLERYDIPTDEEADVILHDICRVAPERIRHNEAVAGAAVAIGEALHAAGHGVDVEAVRLAARLHDIAKGQRQHDIVGGNILRELGFGGVADIVGVHSDLAGGDTGLSLEAKVVYIADKLIMGENQVTLEERYDSANRRFAVTPEIEAAINARLEVARVVKRDLENLIGRSLDEVIARSGA